MKVVWVRFVSFKLRGLQRVPTGAAFVLAGFVAAGSSIALGESKPSKSGSDVETIKVVAHPIAAFDREDAGKTRFGKLTWRGGLVLTSPSLNFGGWSGLALDAEGKKLFALSDAGTWMTGEIAYAGGKPAGLERVRLGPIRSLSGKTLHRKRDHDAEGLALVKGSPEKGSVLISFERKHRIGRFDIGEDGLSAALSYVDLPAAAKSMKANRGIEAVAVLRGGPYKGSLVALAENLPDPSGNHTGWLWVKDKPLAFHLTNPADFDITDAAGLPDGSLLVLERRFRWNEGVKARLRLIRRDELQPGSRIEGETLLEAGMSREIDNMEGLAVHAGPAGEIIVTMISDDNFNRLLQRTLLLQFAVDGADLAHARP